jgi:hypothetical protein
MFVELSVMEQRYHAVMEVISGAPVTEVAGRYGVTRRPAWFPNRGQVQIRDPGREGC